MPKSCAHQSTVQPLGKSVSFVCSLVEDKLPTLQKRLESSVNYQSLSQSYHKRRDNHLFLIMSAKHTAHCLCLISTTKVLKSIFSNKEPGSNINYL